jgi:hypothetical protein
MSFILAPWINNAQWTPIERADLSVKKEGFPWPWSDQCEFDWEAVNGNWYLGDKASTKNYYYLEAFSSDVNGNNFLVVLEFDKEDRLVSRGFGMRTQGENGVLVTMEPSNRKKGEKGYWMYFSWVSLSDFASSSDTKADCKTTKTRYLAVKITGLGASQDDLYPDYLNKLGSAAEK